MKVYVATKFENQTRAKEVAAQLEAAGHTITYKWWHNEQLSADQAMADVWGVKLADAVVFIAENDYAYRGTYVEFGIAVATNTPIYVLGTAFDSCIFMRLPNVQRGIETLLQATASAV